MIDQALGIRMVTRMIGAHAAFEILRNTSQTTNRKVNGRRQFWGGSDPFRLPRLSA